MHRHYIYIQHSCDFVYSLQKKKNGWIGTTIIVYKKNENNSPDLMNNKWTLVRINMTRIERNNNT